jgi:hypothetical protein
MIGVLAILGAVLLLAIILRLGTAALLVSGLSRDVARFQVRSAFFGVGFTTSEAETITDHPFRRRLVQALMLLGSIGITSVIGSAVLTFATTEDSIVLPLIALIAGLVVLYGLASWKWLDRRIVRLFERVLRRYTDLDTHDYHALLRISDDYAIRQFVLRPGGRAVGRAIGDVVGDTPLVLLGIERDGAYIGAPERDTVLQAGDLVTAYGRNELLEAVSAHTPQGSAAAAPR